MPILTLPLAPPKTFRTYTLNELNTALNSPSSLNVLLAKTNGVHTISYYTLDVLYDLIPETFNNIVGDAVVGSAYVA